MKASSCRRRNDCRLCGSRELDPAFALTPTPPANAFVPGSLVGTPQPVYPLELFLCRACGHLQLSDVVDPGELFSEYVYVSGTSPVFVAHFRDYVSDAMRRFSLKPGDLVVDVGSNDGTLLRFFKEAGLKVLGVDPAREIARRATGSGIETLPEFFTPALARRIKGERGPAALVTGNNVFAHADDLSGFAAGVRELLAPRGAFIFEVSYLVDVVEKTLFDTVYHEHLAYHAVRPLVPFFAANGLCLAEAERVPTHGGSLRGYVRRAEDATEPGPSVRELCGIEGDLRLDLTETFRAYAARIEALRGRLHGILADLKDQGKRAAGYGAPAKLTTFMYHMGLGPETVDFVVDDSPLKQGLYTPGHHIPVVPSPVLYERKPDYLILLAWNFAEAIMAKHVAYRDKGGRFLVPLPEPRLV